MSGYTSWRLFQTSGDAVTRLEKSLAVTENEEQFNIALNYGSRHEIVEGFRSAGS
jgi:undecaprenyl pyrophosphate synthase